MLDDQALIAEFVIESKEHLAGVESQLLALEGVGAAENPELVNQVFRAVHSIKGAAGFLGFTTLSRLAHELENVFNLVRTGELIPDASVTDVLLGAADKLQELLDDIEHSNEQDVSAHVDTLQTTVRALLNGESSPPGQGSEAPASDEPPPTEQLDDSPSSPGDASAWLRASDEETAAPGPQPPAADSVLPPESPSLRQPRDSATPPPVMKSQTAQAAGCAAGDTSIRVAVAVLDRLMNLAGELVLSRNQLLQIVNAKDARNVGGVASRLDQITSELQETVMQTRMQEIGVVFNRFPRVVRDLGAALGKQCELRLEGCDVELDKSIIEAIGDPLTHLVRNAIDHGVEAADQRIQAGKAPKGTITLRAFHQAGKVNITISDDGRGIDAARLREKAAARGLISPDQAREMSDRETLRLIFRPGFSLAEKVTDVSGRGVGMDVVKTNIERLGGTVGVETELGLGTKINVKLPLTLAIIPSLIVRCRDQRFAIPQASISELVRVKAEEVQTRVQRIKNAEVFRLRGDLLPLVRLNQALRAAAETPASDEGQAARGRALQVIVVETGQLRYGLVVDGLHDSEEIVVKPLGRHMQGCPCLAGATILGDGRVAMILDVTGIAAHCHLALPDEADAAKILQTDDASSAETQDVLLFSNDPAEWFAVPMDLIARVERIRGDQIDSVGGQLVLQYRGATLPLVSLDQYIAARPRPDKNRLYVAVYRVLQRELGLIVPELVDIRRIRHDIDMDTFREPGVIGSLVLDGKATRLLDLYELTEAARPDWFKDRPRLEQGGDERPPAVLLAEDSDFFRKQLTTFLAAENYEVMACGDGEEAWNALCADPGRFGLVVTDIEMPRMNGFELARRIKDNPATSQLPVIAVTSLASDEDVQRGKEAGVDEYLIKVDRDLLVATAARYLQTAASAALG